VKINWRSEIVSLILLLSMFVLAGITWPAAPERIPVHWGFSGEPDRYGGKFEGLLVIPLIALGLYLMLVLLPRIDPRGERYNRFAGVYVLIRTVIIACLAVIEVMAVLWARGIAVNTGIIVPVAVGLLLMVIGNFMGKIRPNWFVGIRTPWTLSSEESWNKTHRLGGKMFVIMGLFMAAASLFQKTWLFTATIGLLLAGIIVLYVYSYRIWKNDPAAKHNRFNTSS
jgi:uncharacterized membrane protein